LLTRMNPVMYENISGKDSPRGHWYKVNLLRLVAILKGQLIPLKDKE
jgi:hypothetical protein